MRDERESQEPKVTQEACGVLIGKSGSLIRLFETGYTDLGLEDRVALSRRTGIPIADWLSKEEGVYIGEISQEIAGDAG